MFCSTSSSGLGRMESFADNSSSRRLRSNSACQSVSMSSERRRGACAPWREGATLLVLRMFLCFKSVGEGRWSKNLSSFSWGDWGATDVRT